MTSNGATYDAAGDMTSDGTTNYTFDEMNRMTQASGPYGAFGYAYSPGENKRMVVYGSSSNPQTLKMFLYAPNGKLLSQLAYQKNGSAWAPLATNALTNYLLGGKALTYAENNVSSNASGTYWPYGSTNTNPTTGPSTFATYLGDFSGLYYADQRFYDYNWGRFLTADPSGKNIDPTASGSFNRYAYVNGDSANGMDRDGLGDGPCGGGSVCYDGGTGNSGDLGDGGSDSSGLRQSGGDAAAGGSGDVGSGDPGLGQVDQSAGNSSTGSSNVDGAVLASSSSDSSDGGSSD